MKVKTFHDLFNANKFIKKMNKIHKYNLNNSICKKKFYITCEGKIQKAKTGSFLVCGITSLTNFTEHFMVFFSKSHSVKASGCHD